MFEIKINQLSGKLFFIINVNKLDNTFYEIKEIFIDFNFDKCFKIVNNDNIIYTDLYDLDYDNIILNNILTIIFLPYNKNFITTIKFNYHALDYADFEIKNNYDIIKSACNQNSFALQYASNELINNLDIIKMSCKNNGLALRYASISFKNNIHIVKLACMQNGLALEFASDEIKNNYDIVLIACSNIGLALQFASDELKNNYDIVKIASSNYYYAL